MKRLIVKSTAFIYIEKSFKEWLDVLGYAEQTVYSMPNYIRALLHFIEQKGKTEIKHITRDLIKEYDKKVMLYEDGIRNARHDAYQYGEAQRREALAERQDLMAQAKVAATAQIEAAKQEIGNQSAVARTGLEKEAMAMAAKVSSSILHRPVNAPEGS